jgi:hypothetical protein
MPNVRNYWSASLGYRQISDVMSKNESERIRRFLHFADNTKMPERNDANYDKLYKLRPVIDALNSKSQSTKARHHLKQYLPAKPHNWGYKLYVLCGADVFHTNLKYIQVVKI